MTIQPRAKRRWHGESGAELIEFALVFMILLFLVLGIVDFAFSFHHQEVVTNAAREGARVAVLPGYDATDVRNRVASYIAAAGMPTTAGNPSVAVTATTVPNAGGTTWPATTVGVSYSDDYLFLDSLLGGSFSSVALGAQATMRHEMSGP